MVQKLVTGVQLAGVLQVSDETIRKWRRRGIIPAIHINRTTIRYDVADVVSALKRDQPEVRAEE